MVCQQEFKAITGNHLERKHNITMEQYREQYPDAEVFSSTQKDTAYRRAGGAKKKEEVASTKTEEIADNVYELQYNEKGQLIGWVKQEAAAEPEAEAAEKASN